ncbi:MAG TPA: murein biosynthesis integral membrane protein MurJ [Candidatus Sulfomarinibacteraceae bacterium]|nr:murein biosynthesis integral membrane protein MurJ [Candidatus Sulfomarinibacteraceae bacterium]
MSVSEKIQADQSPESGRAQVLRAAGIVSTAFVASRILGLLRDVVIGYYFGATSVEANAYRIAVRIPETIFFVIAGGALGSAFIPTFAGYFARDDEYGAWRLFSAVINLVTVVLLLVCGLVFVFADEFLLLYLPELAQEAPRLLSLTVDLLRVMLLSTVIFGASGVFMAALNARQHFLLPAIAPMVYNLGIIGGAVLLAPNVMGLAWGAVAGSAGHLLVQLPGLRRHRAVYRPILTLKHAGVRQVLRLMAPRVLGLSFSQLNNLIIPFLAQFLGLVFAIAALDYAWRIVLMPQSILGQALGIAAFPTFATLAATMELPQMRRIFADTLRLILFLGLPATILLMALAEPLVTLAFQRGAFTAADTALTASALVAYAPGLVALASLEVVSRAFYAMEDTKTPVLAGALQLTLMAGLGFLFSGWLFPRFGLRALGGLALAISVSNLLETGLLLWLLRRKMSGIGGRRLWHGLWRMSLAALVMGLAVWFTRSSAATLPPLWQLVLGGASGGIAYLLASLALRVDELHQILGYARQRLPV